jgi:hypothetical protein
MGKNCPWHHSAAIAKRRHLLGGLDSEGERVLRGGVGVRSGGMQREEKLREVECREQKN